jgi:hypothetical protein
VGGVISFEVNCGVVREFSLESNQVRDKARLIASSEEKCQT